MEREQEPQDRRLIHTIWKSSKHQIQISLARYRGRTFGDLRTFVLNQHGDWIPTQRGCTVDIDQLAELEEAVARLRDASAPTIHQPF